MNRWQATGLMAVLCGLTRLLAQTPEPTLTNAAAVAAPAVQPAPAKPVRVVEPADVPSPRKDKDGKPILATHEKFVQRAREGHVGLLLLGDSITAGWAGQKALFTNTFGAYQPANFGIGGDRTQNVLWRIQNGELEGIAPQAVMLMIGTNNTGANKPEEIAAGIEAIVRTLREKLPNTKILLLAVLPRGEKPASVRDTIRQVNTLIAPLADGQTVRFLDMGSLFLKSDGMIDKAIMADFLHLTAAGYKIWADAVAPVLAEMMP